MSQQQKKIAFDDQSSEISESSGISFAFGTKNEPSALQPFIKNNTISYNVGMLKVGFIYKAMLQLIHEYDEKKYKIEIPFKHTTNITVIDAIKSDKGHNLCLQLHPQNELKMNDYLDIQFIGRKEDENENEEKDNKNMIQMKLKIIAKVLRKDQGTPFLKPGVSCLSKGAMYQTDMSATEWEQPI